MRKGFNYDSASQQSGDRVLLTLFFRWRFRTLFSAMFWVIAPTVRERGVHEVQLQRYSPLTDIKLSSLSWLPLETDTEVECCRIPGDPGRTGLLSSQFMSSVPNPKLIVRLIEGKPEGECIFSLWC